MPEATTSNNEFDAFAKTVEEAIAIIREQCQALEGYEACYIGDALGRVLAMGVSSPSNVPAHRNSAMDGYAIRAKDLEKGQATLRVVGRSLAGHPCVTDVSEGECVRIMTGAMMPAGADTVVMQEVVKREGDLATIQEPQRTGANVRHPGDDIKAGEEVLSVGRCLTPADLGLLASMGMAEVRVYRQPRVVFFSTGDELKGLGQPLGPGDIYDSNRYTLAAMLRQAGARVLDMGVIPDEPAAVRKAFEEASSNGDMIITTGGVSVGEADYVARTLEEIGQVNFWKIAMKPGRPLSFGRVGDAIFFGLPGNPVSTMATFQIFVAPALEALQGKTPSPKLTLRAKLMDNIKKIPGRTDYQRGIFEQDSTGQLCVRTTGIQASHVLRSMSLANCFVVIPRESGDISAGEYVTVMPFIGS